MRQLKIGDKKYIIPQSWVEVTVADFEKVYKIISDKTEEQLQYKVIIKIVCSVTAIPEPDLLKAPKTFFDLIVKELDFLWAKSYKYIPQSNNVLIDGVKYVFPTEGSEITLGQWVDLDEVAKGEDAISSMLAILMLPQGEEHNSKDFYKRRDKIKALKMDKVLPLISFFLGSGERYITVLKHFLQAKEAGLKHLQRLETSLKNGDGIKPLYNFQRALYLKWTRLLKGQLLRS
jgi:hypothetical protein